MSGRVYLVGAGPGDPGLLTARALELIASADVIVYDRLIPESALDGARADAELLFAGKQGGGEQVPQEQTETLLLERAREGKQVVRLKGGDPFVFGRGGEEALTLRDAEIPFEVVSGVTAGVAALAYAGIPVRRTLVFGFGVALALATARKPWWFWDHWKAQVVRELIGDGATTVVYLAIAAALLFLAIVGDPSLVLR